MPTPQMTELEELEDNFQFHWDGRLDRIQNDTCGLIEAAGREMALTADQRSAMHKRIVAGISQVLIADCNSVRTLDLSYLPRFALEKLRSAEEAHRHPGT